MSAIAVAIGGAALVGAVASNQASKKSASAADNATAAQTASAQAGLDQQQAQFDRVQQLLGPYVQSGNAALEQQTRLLGLRGDNAQGEIIDNLQNSAQFKDLAQQGENSILQNASATGGLRGGNTQGALAQFRPALLSSMIDQYYQRLGGLTNIGQNAAAGVGNTGQAVANNSTALLGQQGAAAAGNALAQGRAQIQGINGVSNAFGTALSGLPLYAASNPSYANGITGTAGGNAGAYSTGTTLNNNFGGTSPVGFSLS